MSGGRLFWATGPATQNARLPSCSLVLGTTKSPRAAERGAAGWEQSRLGCTVRWDNVVPGGGLPCAPEGKVWTRCAP